VRAPNPKYAFIAVNNDITIAAPTHSSAIKRKLLNLRAASLRNKLHADSLPASGINNDATSLFPVPKPPTKRKEVKVSRGIELWGFDSVLEACAKEIKKNFITYKSLALTSTPKLEPDAMFVPSQMLVKRKSSGTISARLPLGGETAYSCLPLRAKTLLTEEY
jgi:hypothetical protein